MGEGHLGQIFKIDMEGNILGEMTPYEARAVGNTYRNNIFDSGGYWTGLDPNNRHNLEDVRFSPGPWGGVTGTFSISRVQFSLLHVSAATGPASIQYKFYNVADCDFTHNPMITAGATPVLTWTIGLPTAGLQANTGYGFNPVNFTPVTIPAGNYFIDARLINPTTQQDLGSDIWRLCACTSTHAPQNGTTPGNPCTIGSTLGGLGDDINFNGTFEGGAVTTTENRQWGYNVAGAFWNIGLDLTLGGEIPATPPTCQSVTLGADNTFVPDTAPYTATQVKWYCFTLSGAADDTALKYVDVDTEGSAVDAAIGIYGTGGVLLAKDDNSGSANNAQMSFGIGRRAATGDGVQYDGRNYDTTAATSVGLTAGTYYVAVAPSGVGSGATFADGFSVTGNGAAGSITVRVRTNAVGGALQPSVPPTSTLVTGTGGENPIVAPGGQTLPVPLTGPGVLWYDVNLCSAADSNNTVTFDGTGTAAFVYSINVFNGNGNQVGQATGSDTVPAVVSFGGSNGALPAGHYYAAMTYDAAPDLAPDPAGAGRWHLRAKNGSQGYNFALSVTVPWNTCLPPCGTADFDCDGDTATDFDIEAFFRCLAGNCPAAPCPNNADFNGDGDTATDADIESFFRVLAGGPC